MKESLNHISHSTITINKGSTKLLIAIVSVMVIAILGRDLFVSDTKQTEALVKELDHKNTQLDKQDKKLARLQEKFRILREKVAKEHPEDLEEVDKVYEQKGLDAAIYFMESLFEKVTHVEPLVIENQKTPVNKVEVKVNPEATEQPETTIVEEKQSPPKTELVVRSKSVVIDGVEYENIPFIEKYTWDEANAHCTDRGEGWRLPTRKELHKIANIELYGQYDSNWQVWFEENNYRQLQNSKGTSHFIREEFIENMPKYSLFWTSEEKDSSDAWYVYFKPGNVYWYFKSDHYYALCVR